MDTPFLISVQRQQISPVQAEIHWWCVLTNDSDGEIRGLVRGPQCFDRETIQLAYPLKTVAQPTAGRFLLRVIIPEPNLWENDAPFVYAVHLEWWCENEKRAEHSWDIALSSSGVSER